MMPRALLRNLANLIFGHRAEELPWRWTDYAAITLIVLVIAALIGSR
jgi:hypothetical protein